MTRTIYDFSKVEEVLRNTFTPAELVDNLKTAAMRCAMPDADVRAEMVLNMQLAALDICEVIEAIKVIEVKEIKR